MKKDLESTFVLDGGTYVVKLFNDVRLESTGNAVTAHWPAFGLTATGDDEADVLAQLVEALRAKVGTDETADEYRPLVDYVRRHGMWLSDEQAAAREMAKYREARLRWRVTTDEQYFAPLFRDIDVQRDADTVTVRAFDLEGTGPTLVNALKALKREIDRAAGTQDAPGPRYDEITNWVRSQGERVGADVLTAEAEENAAYVAARDRLAAIIPEDIEAESSTGIPLLVDFWAEWCGPCRMVAPVLAELAQRWEGRIAVRKIDVDQFEGVWERFGFRGIPAMLLFRDGEEIHRVLGFGGKAKLVAELEPHLATG